MKPIIMLLALTFLTCLPTFAGHPWLTTRTYDGQSEPIKKYLEKSAAANNLQFISTATSTAVDSPTISLVFSIHNAPAGNNEGNKRESPLTAQDKYENVIVRMAQAVYDMTEGAHKIGKVSIFVNGKQGKNADVKWSPSGGPYAKGTVGQQGSYIEMFDNFSGTDMLVDKNGGYTTAHELGHYIYGLMDEYDISKMGNFGVCQGSIMNSQWNARNDLAWLNFSYKMDNTNTTQNWVSPDNTAQYKFFDGTCWETMGRAGSKDPTNMFTYTRRVTTATGHSYNQNVSYKKARDRISWPAIVKIAPTVLADGPKIQVDTAAGRTAATNKLDIVWMTSNTMYQIVIDHSGSMGSDSTNPNLLANRLENVKKATYSLIDAMQTNDYVGVVAFDDSVSVIYPITKLESVAQKGQIKAIVAQLTPAGATAIGDAALTALNGVLGAKVTSVMPIVFLLTDGQNNSGIDPSSVIPLYRAAKVPIMGFGYGSSVGSAVRNLSDQTGGKYYNSPTTLSGIITAFKNAQEYVIGNTSIGYSKKYFYGDSDKEVRVKEKFLIDSSLTSFSLIASIEGQANTNSFMLKGKGQKLKPSNIDTSSGTAIITFEVKNAKAGPWKLMGKTSADSSVECSISGVPEDFTYNLYAAPTNVADVIFPKSIFIKASLAKDFPIENARVSAIVNGPDGITWQIKKFKDHENGDYTYNFDKYLNNGTHSFTIIANSRGSKYTLNGLNLSDLPDGTQVANITKIKDKFGRAEMFSVDVSGMNYSPEGYTSSSPYFNWPTIQNATGFSVDVYRWETKKKGSGSYKKHAHQNVKAGVYSCQFKKPFEAGDYYWTITPKYKGFKSQHSAPVKFYIY